MQPLNGELERVRRRIEAFDREIARGAEAERLRLAGDLILTYLRSITPGQSVLEVDGEKIDMDPTLKPSENAQAYYRQYAKARDAVNQVPELRNAAATRLRYLEECVVQLELAVTPDGVNEIAAELRESGVSSSDGRKLERRGRARDAETGPGLLRIDGAEILVGRTGRQNDEVTFRLAQPDDLWLHARGVPGAHVVIRGAAREPDNDIVRVAAGVAAYFSKSQQDARVAVDVTRQRHVRRPKGSPPGLVTYSAETTLHVAPALPSPLTRVGWHRSTGKPSTAH
jgi:predicted ribosome quality control (RQC) complex YloA/Tae2 family protein